MYGTDRRLPLRYSRFGGTVPVVLGATKMENGTFLEGRPEGFYGEVRPERLSLREAAADETI